MVSLRGPCQEAPPLPPSLYGHIVAHIEIVGPDEATGTLERIYRQRTESAGRLWNIVSVQCQNPETLRESMRLYAAAMFCDSPLTRAQREMIAVVTSQVNECHY